MRGILANFDQANENPLRISCANGHAAALPPEILQLIFAHFSPDDFGNWAAIKQVCKWWHSNAAIIHRFDTITDLNSIELSRPRDYSIAVRLGLDPRLLIDKLHRCSTDVVAAAAATNDDKLLEAIDLLFDINQLTIDEPQIGLIILRNNRRTNFGECAKCFLKVNSVEKNGCGDTECHDCYGEYGKRPCYYNDEYWKTTFAHCDVYERPSTPPAETVFQSDYYKVIKTAVGDANIDEYKRRMADAIADDYQLSRKALYLAAEFGHSQRRQWLVDTYNYPPDVLVAADEINRLFWHC